MRTSFDRGPGRTSRWILRCGDRVRLPADDPRQQVLRSELITGYLPVAHHVARRCQYRGENLDDLDQVAAIGLINAVDRVDPERGPRRRSGFPGPIDARVGCAPSSWRCGPARSGRRAGAGSAGPMVRAAGPGRARAVSVASAARARARTGEPGRCTSIATDTAAQPKIARIAMTTAHRWDTRYSLCAPPSEHRTAFRSFRAEKRITRQGTRRNFAPVSSCGRRTGERSRFTPDERMGTRTLGVACGRQPGGATAFRRSGAKRARGRQGCGSLVRSAHGWHLAADQVHCTRSRWSARRTGSQWRSREPPVSVRRAINPMRPVGPGS